MRELCAMTIGAVALGSLAVAGLPSAALAAGPDHHIYRTDGDGVIMHVDAGLSATNIGVLSDGTTFTPDCWTTSDFVDGNPVWLHGKAGPVTGWVTDYYVDTHWRTTNDLVAQGIPQCGNDTPTTPVQPAPDTAPVVDSATHIVLHDNAGVRERNLLGLSSVIDQAASDAGVDGQTLARVIYHEGGNYLEASWRRRMTGEAELAFLGDHSVGIGQIKPSTARDVDNKIYHTDDSALTDSDVKSKLIYDQNYAIRIAAGYLRILLDEGLGTGWPQFMAYSLSPQLAATWKHAGHPMDTTYLTAQGFNVEKFQARQQKYNEAVNAIG
jgi:hypothetical protein